MPKLKRAGKARTAREALAMLAALAADGAYAACTATADGKQAFVLRAADAEPTPPGVHVPQSVAAYALRVGWITPDPSATRLHITAAGRRALQSDGAREVPGHAAAPRERAAARPGGESALAWLRNRKDKDGRPLITEVQFTAGERLAADFWHAQLSPRVTANWSAMAPGRRMRRAAPGFGVEMRDAAMAARRRFHRALDVVGPELAGILADVCCHDIGLETAGRAAGWPQRAARVVLDLALTRLARHYGLIAPERPADGRIWRWGDADYRPTLDAWAQERAVAPGCDL
jgi:hypothetical protein